MYKVVNDSIDCVRYPIGVIRNSFIHMEKSIDLNSAEFQRVLAEVCKMKGVSVDYVNKHAYIIVSGHSQLDLTNQRMVANCMRIAMQKYDEMNDEN